MAQYFSFEYVNQFIQFVDVKKLKNISGSLMQTFIYKQVYFLGENNAYQSTLILSFQIIILILQNIHFSFFLILFYDINSWVVKSIFIMSFVPHKLCCRIIMDAKCRVSFPTLFSFETFKKYKISPQIQ